MILFIVTEGYKFLTDKINNKKNIENGRKVMNLENILFIHPSSRWDLAKVIYNYNEPSPGMTYYLPKYFISGDGDSCNDENEVMND